MKENIQIHFIDDLISTYNYSVMEVEFLIDSINVIDKAKRVLQWTYVYGFYCPTEERQLLESIQGLLEHNCEVLYGKIELEDQSVYLTDTIEARSLFWNYKSDVTSWLDATKKFAKNLEEQMEVGLMVTTGGT